METYELGLGFRDGLKTVNCKVLVSSDCGKDKTNALLKGLVETWNTTEYDFFVREASTMPEPPHIRVFADGPGNELCQGYKWLFEHGRNPELVDWETEDGAKHGESRRKCGTEADYA